MMTIASTRVDAIDAITGIFKRFTVPMDSDVLERDVRELCRNFRILAAAGLLVEADIGKFSANLARAGINWAGLLRNCRTYGVRAPKMSDLAALFGALAGGHYPLASTLARLMKDQDRQANEYPAEYAFARLFVYLTLSEELTVGQVRALADDLLVAGGKLTGERAAMACTLAEGDPRAFYAAFADMAEEQELYTERLAAAFTTDWRTFVAERYIWLEGLAWLRLAAARGWTRPREFPYCSSLVLDVQPPVYQPDWILPPFRTAE